MKVHSSFGDREICILGLGYVGLTLVAAMANVGFKVTGVEIRESLVEELRSGNGHFHEPGLEDMLRRGVEEGRLEWHTAIPAGCEAQIFIITVGTPLDDEGRVRVDMIERVAGEIAAHAADGSLVILRSTVMVGTTRNRILPILRKSGKNISAAFCPERTLEGKALTELRHLPQIVGSADNDVIVRATQIFQFLTPTVVRVKDYETAEMIKLVDNAQRDVLFAFANEVAAMCDALEISADSVIRSGKLGYSRHSVPLPGPVGGPCLSKDTYILAESVAQLGIRPNIALTCRRINEDQLEQVVDFLSAWASCAAGFPESPVVSLLGLAFKGRPPTDDLRGTTARPVLDALKRVFPTAVVQAYDAEVAAEDIRGFGVTPVATLEDAFEGASLVLILNNHPVFEVMPTQELAGKMRAPGLIYDLWHNFVAEELRLPDGIGYAALGSHCEGQFPNAVEWRSAITVAAD